MSAATKQAPPVSSQRPNETDYGYLLRIIDTIGAEAVLRQLSAAQKLAKACKLTIGMNPFGSLENREAIEAAKAALKTWEEANK